MSVPAVDGGGRSSPWRPASVIFLLNQEAACLTSGGDFGAVRSLRLEHVFASGDRWPHHTPSPRPWPGWYRTHDVRVADALSSIGVDVCGNAVSPAAGPTSEDRVGSGHSGLDSGVTRLPPARPGSGCGSRQHGGALHPRLIPMPRGDSRPGARHADLNPRRARLRSCSTLLPLKEGCLWASRALQGGVSCPRGTVCVRCAGAILFFIVLFPFSLTLLCASPRSVAGEGSVRVRTPESCLRRRLAEKHRKLLVWEVVTVAGNQRRTMAHLSFPLPR